MNFFVYVVKKVLSWPMYPLGAALTLLTVGVIVLFKGRRKLGTFIVLTGTLILFVFSLSWTGLTLLRPLELEAGAYADPSSLRAAGIRYIVVLGNNSVQFGVSPADRWATGLPRLLEGIRLWREIPDAKLVLSGAARGSAEAMAELPVQLGIPMDAMIIRTNFLDTVDEVDSFKEIVGAEPFALVTSAFHMPRAVTLFKEKGANPIPCPCGFENRRLQTYRLFIPGLAGLVHSTEALHEYYGRFFYWIKALIIKPKF